MSDMSQYLDDFSTDIHYKVDSAIESLNDDLVLSSDTLEPTVWLLLEQ